jgi:tRNA(adenine34) deaminase
MEENNLEFTQQDYEFYMDKALELAHEAADNTEVPIGCVIVYKGEIIGKGCNLRVTKHNVLAHAEILAINEACDYMNDWRLEDCTLFVTVEPCPMCAGAILQARVKRVVFGARNPKAGCVRSIYNMLEDDRFNHKVEVIEGIKQDECAIEMKNFFRRFRK